MTALIRMANLDDAEAIRDIYAPFCAEDSPVSFEVGPPSVEEMRRRIAACIECRPWLVCERENALAGYAYASRYRERAAYRWSIEVGLYIADDARRSGVGRGLYTTLLKILAAQNYVGVYAGVTLPNEGSAGLHEAMGFEAVGVYKKAGFKAGGWRDVGWYQKELRPAPERPEEPINVHAIVAGEAWREAIAAGERLVRC